MTTRFGTAALVAASTCAFALSLVTPASGQTIVVPNTPETNGTSFPIRSTPSTYQAYYNQSNFAAVTGPVLITGVRYRVASPFPTDPPLPNYPTQPLTWAEYTIQLSQPSAAINADGEIISGATTFAQNQGAGVTTVRSGSLTFAAGAFTQLDQEGVANPFGPTIAFTTPYQYTPGTGLMFTVGHTGHGNTTEPVEFMATTPFTNGVADAIGLANGNNFSATPSTFSSPVIVEFTFAPVPEPAAVLAAAAAGLGAAGWVRRRVRA